MMCMIELNSDRRGDRYAHQRNFGLSPLSCVARLSDNALGVAVDIIKLFLSPGHIIRRASLFTQTSSSYRKFPPTCITQTHNSFCKTSRRLDEVLLSHYSLR